MDRIDPDVPLRELQHCGLRQAAEPPFAGGVGGVVATLHDEAIAERYGSES
jgi:hypothetical protein